MGELPSRESLKMSLLLFTLISTALAMPAHDCPPFPPADCGEGMRSCPGDTDPMGCPMPEICVAEGDECPFLSTCRAPPLRICHVQLSWTRRRKRLRDPYELYHGGLGCG